jgi:hypothetical protein
MLAVPDCLRVMPNVERQLPLTIRRCSLLAASGQLQECYVFATVGNSKKA